MTVPQPSTEDTMETKEYREIPFGFDACTVCDEVVPHLRERRLNTRPSLRLHGPRGNRCEGSHQQGKPWIEAAGLPAWDELSDLDKGNALMFVWKCHWEHSYIYARENYPATFTDHPVLRELSAHERCRYAAEVCRGGSKERASAYLIVSNRLGAAEFDRLYELALAAERAA